MRLVATTSEEDDMTARKPTTPTPSATPSAPTPVSPALLAGLTREPRTSRVGQAAVLLAAPTAAATATPAATPTATRKPARVALGVPIKPSGRYVLASQVTADSGYFYAVRTAHPKSATDAKAAKCIGNLRVFAFDDGATLPSVAIGTTFESHVATAGSPPAGTWQIVATPAECPPVLLNYIRPLAAS